MRLLLTRFAGYFVTGGTAAIVDVGLFALLLRALAPFPAAAGSYAVAVTVNFLLTSRFVYDRKPGWRLYASFLALALIGLVVNVTVTLLAVPLVGEVTELAKIAGIGTAFVANFLMVNYVVFADRDDG